MLEHIKVSTILNRSIPDGFNWCAILKDLAAGAPLTGKDHLKLTHMSANWVTCACGQVCGALPRNGDGSPTDFLLRIQGGMFHHAILEMNWTQALGILHNIEQRTRTLLNDREVI